MKKSMLMLVALFMLGACSTVDDVEWKDVVGGKYVYGVSAEDGDDTPEPMYYFSPDASVIYVVGSIQADDDYAEWFIDYDSAIDIKSSDATSATYEDSYEDGTLTISFTDLKDGAGAYEEKYDGELGDRGTFTLETTLPLTVAKGDTYVNEDGDSYFFGDNGTLVETDDEGSCTGTYVVTDLGDYTVNNNADPSTEITELNDYDKLYELTVSDEMMSMVTYAVVKIADDKMYMIYAMLSEDEKTVTVFADDLDDDNADVYTKQ